MDGYLDAAQIGILATRAMRQDMRGNDGFLEALEAADKIVAGKKTQVAQQRALEQQKHTQGFLSAIMGGEDPALAYKAFPQADQQVAIGYLDRIANEKRAQSEYERRKAEENETYQRRLAEGETAYQRRRIESLTDDATAETASNNAEQQKAAQALEQQRLTGQTFDLLKGGAPMGNVPPRPAMGPLAPTQAPQQPPTGFLDALRAPAPFQFAPQPGMKVVSKPVTSMSGLPEENQPYYLAAHEKMLNEEQKRAEIEAKLRTQAERVQPPQGYRFTPAGDLEPIPGGPATKAPTYAPPSGYRYTANGNLERIPGGPEPTSSPSSYKPPAGYRFTPEGDLEAIPGGPAAQKIGIQEEKTMNLLDGIDKKATIIINNIDSALGKAGFMETGLTGSIVGNIPGTDAYSLRRIIDTVKANIGFQELTQMRQASPTGGALGQVAVQELNFLQAALGNLDPNQSEDELRKQLGLVKEHFTNWRNAVRQDMEERKAGAAAPAPTRTPAPAAGGGAGAIYLQKYGGQP